MIQISGQKFNRLTAVCPTGRRRGRRRSLEWKFVCDCGTVIERAGSDVKCGNIKSCGCLLTEAALNGLKFAAPKLHNPRKGSEEADESVIASAIYRYRKNCIKTKREWLLSNETAKNLLTGNCYYCGQKPPQPGFKVPSASSVRINGIDRLDNNKGYTAENCVSCCKGCNYGKRTSSMLEFIAMCNSVSNLHSAAVTPIDYFLMCPVGEV